MDHSERKEVYFPEYSWELIKSYLIVKIHPVAKMIKTYAIRYKNPSIFITNYVQLRNGEYKYSRTGMVDISNPPEDMIWNFHFYLKCKKIILQFCESCKKKSSVFIVNTSPYSSGKKYCFQCSQQISLE